MCYLWKKYSPVSISSGFEETIKRSLSIYPNKRLKAIITSCSYFNDEYNGVIENDRLYEQLLMNKSKKCKESNSKFQGEFFQNVFHGNDHFFDLTFFAAVSATTVIYLSSTFPSKPMVTESALAEASESLVHYILHAHKTEIGTSY